MRPSKSSKEGPALGVVQRIQRFGGFSQFKQTAFEHIAGQFLSNNPLLQHEGSTDNGINSVQKTNDNSASQAGQGEVSTPGEVGGRQSGSLTQNPSGSFELGTEAYSSLMRHIGETDGVVCPDFGPSAAERVVCMMYTDIQNSTTSLYGPKAS